MERQTHPYRPDYATPPGYVLEDHLEAKGLSPAEFAQRHSVPAEIIEGILDGSTPIDEETAALFGREFSLEAAVWLRMEARYRSELAQKAATDAAN